jgi:hypothetical protein
LSAVIEPAQFTRERILDDAFIAQVFRSFLPTHGCARPKNWKHRSQASSRRSTQTRTSTSSATVR